MTDDERSCSYKTALCVIIDLINEVTPTVISADNQYKDPATNAVNRVKEMIDLFQVSDAKDQVVNMQWRRYLELTKYQEQINKIKDIVEGEN